MISTAIQQNAVSRVLGIKTEFKNLQGGIALLPQRIALIGQVNSGQVFSTDKKQFTNALDVANDYGFGCPLHLAALQFFPADGDGIGTIPLTIYPLADATSGIAAIGNIIPVIAATVAASYVIRVNNIDSQPFIINPGDSVAVVIVAIIAAVTAALNIPVVAGNGTTQVDIVSKWLGSSANGLVIEVIGDLTLGNTFAITQPVGGFLNPSVAEPIALIGDVWETMILNCMEIGDSTALDLFNTYGESRWSALVRKPVEIFTGTIEQVAATAIVIPDARKADRSLTQLVAPGSNDLPFVVAARQVAKIVRLANDNPAHDYGSQRATGLTPGTDAQQWDYAERELAVLGGSSTVQIKDNVVNISDTITFYHPTGDLTPAYRFVVDVVKLQNCLFNINLRFATPEWDGAPLIPDDQVAFLNPSAKRPRMAVAEIAAVIDGLAAHAIISDPEGAKATIQAEIDSINPKRLNISFTLQLSGNTNIISIDFNFGFFFGAIAA